jgi:hypothetical protein
MVIPADSENAMAIPADTKSVMAIPADTKSVMAIPADTKSVMAIHILREVEVETGSSVENLLLTQKIKRSIRVHPIPHQE